MGISATSNLQTGVYTALRKLPSKERSLFSKDFVVNIGGLRNFQENTYFFFLLDA